MLKGSEAEMQRALARDRNGRLELVELKQGKVTQEAVHQLIRYVEGVRGILAAPDISKPALERLQELALEFSEVRALPIEAAAEQRPPLFDG